MDTRDDESVLHLELHGLIKSLSTKTPRHKDTKIRGLVFGSTQAAASEHQPSLLCLSFLFVSLCLTTADQAPEAGLREQDDRVALLLQPLDFH